MDCFLSGDKVLFSIGKRVGRDFVVGVSVWACGLAVDWSVGRADVFSLLFFLCLLLFYFILCFFLHFYLYIWCIVWMWCWRNMRYYVSFYLGLYRWCESWIVSLYRWIVQEQECDQKLVNVGIGVVGVIFGLLFISDT